MKAVLGILLVSCLVFGVFGGIVDNNYKYYDDFQVCPTNILISGSVADFIVINIVSFILIGLEWEVAVPKEFRQL